MTFNQAAVNALVADAVSAAETLGVFETVNSHEPKSSPGSGMRCSMWVQDITGIGAASGLAETSGRVTLNVRVYSSMLSEPQDEIDPALMTAVTTLMGAYSGGFTLEGTVRDIDLLGSYGLPMSAQAGYVSISNRMYRIMTITLPVIINDMWTQEA